MNEERHWVLKAIRTPFFLSGPEALNTLGKFLLVQEGSAVILKCVSCAQRTSQWESCAVFQREAFFAGWFRPFTLSERNFGILDRGVRCKKVKEYSQFVGGIARSIRSPVGFDGSQESLVWSCQRRP